MARISPVVYAAVREAVLSIQADGTKHFGPEDVAGRLTYSIANQEILSTLTEIWKAEGIIYSDVIGGAVWTFGRVGHGGVGRRPLGARR
jgi:hypothetical protein